MQPFPKKPIDPTPKPTGPIVVDPDLLKKFRDFFAPCNKAFPLKFASIKNGPIAATLTIVPFKLGSYDSLYFPQATVSFKAIDAAITAKVAQWKAELPKGAIAYAEFGPVDYTTHASDFNAILFIGSDTTHRMYLNRSLSGHTWPIDYDLNFCNKPSLFVLSESTSNMYINFTA